MLTTIYPADIRAALSPEICCSLPPATTGQRELLGAILRGVGIERLERLADWKENRERLTTWRLTMRRGTSRRHVARHVNCQF